MAGVGGGLSPAVAASRGALSGLARAQYAALAHLRWRMFVNSMRSSRGTIELGAGTVVAVLFSLFGLGVATGLGAASYGIARSSNWQLLPIVFWALFAMWQLIPMMPALSQQQFDIGGLLRFPVDFGAFYLLHLVFGLVDASTIVGGFCSIGIWIGLTLARPDLLLWNTAAVLAFAVFNILLVRAIFTWVERWLAQRRTREIVMALFFVGMLSLQFLNPAFRKHQDVPELTNQQRAEGLRWLHTADAVQRWLPPGMAADAVRRAPAKQVGLSLLALSGLVCFGFGAGGVLGIRLRAEYRGENLGEAPARESVQRRSGQWLMAGSGPVAAVFEKDLRVLLRAIPLLYQIGAPLLMVFVFAGMNHNRGVALPHFHIGVLLCIAYTMVGFTQLIYNNLGGEGAGIQLLFLSPTPVRTVMLAKNAFHAVLFAIDAIVVGVLASWRFGVPEPATLSATAAWVVFALPLHFAVGNIFSLTMPYKINLGRIGRQKGSQANALLSILVQLGTLAVGAGVIAVCAWINRPWLASLILLAMAAGSVLVWRRILGNVDQLARERRDDLIEALMKGD